MQVISCIFTTRPSHTYTFGAGWKPWMRFKKKEEEEKRNNMVDHSTLFFLKNLFFQLMHGLGRRNKKRFYICSEVIDNITGANSGCLGCGLDLVWGSLVVVWG